MFSDKGKTLKATVKALLSEIELREGLNLHLMKNIDYGMCKLGTEVLQLENHKPDYSFDRFLEFKDKKNKLKSEVKELEKEKRKEYLECWKDLMFLKKYLHVALKDYWNLVKKRDVLEGGFG
jgi:hypothetical protein